MPHTNNGRFAMLGVKSPWHNCSLYAGVGWTAACTLACMEIPRVHFFGEFGALRSPGHSEGEGSEDESPDDSSGSSDDSSSDYSSSSSSGVSIAPGDRMKPVSLSIAASSRRAR